MININMCKLHFGCNQIKMIYSGSRFIWLPPFRQSTIRDPLTKMKYGLSDASSWFRSPRQLSILCSTSTSMSIQLFRETSAGMQLPSEAISLPSHHTLFPLFQLYHGNGVFGAFVNRSLILPYPAAPRISQHPSSLTEIAIRIAIFSSSPPQLRLRQIPCTQTQ